MRAVRDGRTSLIGDGVYVRDIEEFELLRFRASRTKLSEWIFCHRLLFPFGEPLYLFIYFLKSTLVTLKTENQQFLVCFAVKCCG